MRPYPRNSPGAAARIVALAALADGNIRKAELDILDRLRAYEQLGLARAEFHAVVQTLCENLLTPGFHGESFFVCSNGRRCATPIFLVLIMIKASDLVFAVTYKFMHLAKLPVLMVR